MTIHPVPSVPLLRWLPVYLAAIYLVSATVVVLFQYDHALQQLHESADDEVRKILYELGQTLRGDLEDGRLDRARAAISRSALTAEVQLIALFDQAGQVIDASRSGLRDSPTGELLPRAVQVALKASSPLSEPKVFAGTSDTQRVGYYPITMGIPHGDTRPQRVNHLVILYDYGSRRAEHMVQSFQQSLRLLAAGLLATLGLYLLLRRYVGRPLLQLATFADRLAEDPSSMRIRYTGRGEVAKLAEALNEMSERITAALVQTRASERDLSTTLDAIRDGVIVTDAAGAITRMNPGAETLTGWPLADAFGRSLMDILPMTGAESGGPVVNPLELALSEGQAAGVANHCTMVAKDGRKLQVSESAAPILSDRSELRGVVLVLRDITDHSTAMQRIEQLALYDPLTSLPNRRTFMERLEQEIARSQRHEHFGALLYLDLDQFKLVNDSLGHQIGDQLLVSVANRLRGAIRREDMAARLGGDEFVVLLPDLGSEERTVSERALSVAKKISTELYHAFPLQSNEIYVTPSIGVTIYPRQGVDANGALQQADIAMYRAKSDGRNTVRLFCASLQEAVEQRAALQAALHRAIEKDAFRLFLQPICKADGRITGAEVLLRWVDEQGTLRLPAEFLQLAEETGLMQRMGEKVLQGACRQMRRLRTLIGEGQACPISVNVSAGQLKHPGFVELVRKTLAAHDLPGSALVLEITEQVLLEDLEEVSAKLGALREDNVRFAIDDFGAGHSSLSYLKRLPVDRLKIDAAFVRDLTTDPDDAAIVQAIIAMAGHLGLETVAEGVETQEQCHFLASRGCQVFQGHLFGRPMPAEDFLAMVAANPVPGGLRSFLARPCANPLHRGSEAAWVPPGLAN